MDGHRALMPHEVHDCITVDIDLYKTFMTGAAKQLARMRIELVGQNDNGTVDLSLRLTEERGDHTVGLHQRSLRAEISNLTPTGLLLLVLEQFRDVTETQ